MLSGVALVVAGAAPSAAVDTTTNEATEPILLAPYYTEADLTGDLQVTAADVDLSLKWLGVTSSSPHWKKVAAADTNGDGVLTVTDIADLAQRMVYDDGPFSVAEASAFDVQPAMNAGATTSVEITQEYLERIAAYDTTLIGSRPLNSIITVNSDALAIAKASMDEFAFGFVSQFSAFQPAGESLLVASPYDTARTAGGSSGGTGAASAANLGVIGFGTDTGGSIRVPSSYNQLVGVRPTVGLASRDGIIPLALSQDTGGPMTRTVIDATVALDAVTGYDPADPVTAAQDGKVPASYTQFLDPDALDGARIGYVPSMIGSNRTTTRLFAEAVTTLEKQGATVVEITPPAGFGAVLSEPSGSTNEFKHDLEEYVANHLSPLVEHRDLQEIVDSGRFVPARRNTYLSRNSVTPERYAAWAGPEGTHTQALAAGKELVTAMLDDHDLDALVYPSSNPFSTQSTNLRLSPNTGMPSVTVPMGQAVAADSTITGAGVNIELLGRDFDEGTLLGLAFAYEQATSWRTAPVLFPELD